MKMDSSQSISETQHIVDESEKSDTLHYVAASCPKVSENDTNCTAELMCVQTEGGKFENNEVSHESQIVDGCNIDVISENSHTLLEIQLKDDKNQEDSVDCIIVNELCDQGVECIEFKSDEVSSETQGVDKLQMDIAISDSMSIEQVQEEDAKYQENKVSCFSISKLPIQITGAWKEYESVTCNNFTKGCKWAPDGSCLLACSNDNKLRLFNLPSALWQENFNWEEMSEMEAALSVSEAELIYDYCWYPHMSSSDPVSCCFLSSSRNSPVHMWDAFNGELRCTYRPYNHVDEIVAPHSLAFDADGQKIYCGFKNMVRIFEVSSPGRNFTARPTCNKKCGQVGIISCFAFTNANRSLSAAGSYSKTVGIYSEPDGMLLHTLSEQKSGVTHLKFSPDGTKLYSGGRKDAEILCWDVRNFGTVLYSLRRICITNQRMYFDVSCCGQYIVSGNQNGVVTIWDSSKLPLEVPGNISVLEPVQFYQAHDDCVNGASFHPSMPLLATSSGQRKFPELVDSDDDVANSKMFSYGDIVKDNSVRMWWFVNEGN